MDQQAKFEGWAIVEIMGHNKEIGYVTTEYFGGPGLFRVDQPELLEREYTLDRPEYVEGEYCPAGTVVKRGALPAKTSLVGPSSIFRITPCDEQTARRAIERMLPVPMTILSLPERGMIPAGVADEDGSDFDADGEEV